MADDEREQFARIISEHVRQQDKASPAAALVLTIGFTICILVFGTAWAWSADGRYLITGGLFMLATVFAAAGLAAYHNARRK